MSVAVILGLLSAACYGVCDFVARSANRKAGVLTTIFWGQAFLAAVLSTAIGVQHRIPQASPHDWLWLTASNLCVLSATGCLYRGLAVGRISVVAPVMASYGAISALLSIASGEHLGWPMAIGLAAAATGAVLSAASGKEKGKPERSGWVFAAGAAVLYGIGYWLQGKFVLPRFGPVFGLWIYYMTAALLSGGLCAWRRCEIRLKSTKDAALIFGTAVLAGGGYAALQAGQATGKIAIVTALSAGSTAFTVVLGAILLKDRPGVPGWLGVGLVIGGVAILDLSK